MTDPKSNGSGPDWASLLEQATPRTKSVRLCLRGDLLAALSDAEAAAAPSLAGETEDVTLLRKQVDESTVDFVVKGASRARYAALEAKHPDPDGEGWNMATFPEALVRECLVSPVVAPEQPLADALTYGEFEKLFTAAVAASIEVNEVPLPKRG